MYIEQVILVNPWALVPAVSHTDLHVSHNAHALGIFV